MGASLDDGLAAVTLRTCLYDARATRSWSAPACPKIAPRSSTPSRAPSGGGAALESKERLIQLLHFREPGPERDREKLHVVPLEKLLGALDALDEDELAKRETVRAEGSLERPRRHSERLRAFREQEPAGPLANMASRACDQARAEIPAD